jgi:polar amino acid transport system substrate-binding protein
LFDAKGFAVTVSPAVLKDLAPTGRLRAAINHGNTILAQKHADGSLGGVTVALARELGKRLNVPVDLVPYDAAGKVFAAIPQQAWDVAFLAIEPVRAAEIEFTAPYVLIEGYFMVPNDSALRTPSEVDREGIRIAVAKGAAYDLFLSRTFKHATLQRAPTGPEALQMMLREKLEVAAGVKQHVTKFAAEHPGLRVMDQRFMAIEQAMGTLKGRLDGVAYLKPFIEEMKASGMIAAELKASGQSDAAVAPRA